MAITRTITSFEYVVKAYNKPQMDEVAELIITSDIKLSETKVIKQAKEEMEDSPLVYVLLETRTKQRKFTMETDKFITMATEITE